MTTLIQGVYLAGLVVLGIVLLLRPIGFLRITYRWPGLVFPLLGDRQRVPRTRGEPVSSLVEKRDPSACLL